ncbi:hypothetical protein KQI74_18570 [Paenibacillus barcinonensis]|uniref:hypothetical protein n=1 Tax=Paenibacillus barcinonensis TaxID=198119 RepID=UPI001C115DA3|nr:hypothetical protein [Paenibacillus barcinonensis]MBU5354296.1 hypothetical protein [Paenibacillus barcinonensis]
MEKQLFKGALTARKLLLSVLIFTLAFGSSSIVSASDALSVSNEERINQIYEERSRVLAEQKEGYLDEFEKLGKELESLGVEFLSTRDVQQKIEMEARKSNDIFVPNVTTPPNSNNIIWSSFRANWVKNGVTYEVQHLTAEPNGSSSSLFDTGGIVLQNSNSLGKATQNLVTTIAKAGASELSGPVDITLQVYDAVKSFINDANFSRTTEVTDIKVNYTYSWWENIDFMYVKKANESDDKQRLTFTSNSVSGRINWTIPNMTYKSNGTVKNVTFTNDQRNFDLYNTNAHRNGSFAVAAYLDPYAQKNAFVTVANLRGVGDKTVKAIPVKTPSTPALLF